MSALRFVSSEWLAWSHAFGEPFAAVIEKDWIFVINLLFEGVQVFLDVGFSLKFDLVIDLFLNLSFLFDLFCNL